MTNNYIPKHAKKDENGNIIEPVTPEKFQKEFKGNKLLGKSPKRESGNLQIRTKVLFLLAVVAFLSLGLFLLLKPNNDNKVKDTTISDITDDGDGLAKMDSKLRKNYLSNKEINEDYVGDIVFDSGLLSVNIVQALDTTKEDGTIYQFYTSDGELVSEVEGYSGNDVYLWTNWRTGEYDPYNKSSSAFFDFRSSNDSQITIIYGHHIARDFDTAGDKGFTPLDLLLEQENYEENKNFKLILDNEIREYVVALTYTADITNYEQISLITDLELTSDVIESLKSYENYETGVELTPEDNIVVLVTCIQHQPLQRQIVVCKETGRTYYE